MSESALSTDALFAELRQHVFVPPEPGRFFANLHKELDALHEPYRSAGQAFAHNLRAVIATRTLPFTFAAANSDELYYQRMFLAARIRARSIAPEAGELDDSTSLERRRDEHAQKVARAKFVEFHESTEGMALCTKDVSERLMVAVRTDGIGGAFEELLLQGLVLTWSAFEVLARDFFVCYMNDVPSAVEVLLADTACKKRFDTGKVPLEVLSEHGYDLSKKMGTVLAAQNDLGDFVTIKVVFLALFGSNPTLRTCIEDRRLWNIAQRRHLIVHRRAIVDADFLKSTNEQLQLGSKLRVSPHDLEDSLGAIRDVGAAILSIGPRQP
jgi:hypothetical protein